MRVVRAALAIVAVFVALWTLYRVPWTRQMCNIEKRRAEQLTTRAETIASDFARQATAVRAAERMERCIASFPSDWQCHVLEGALHQIAERKPAAMASYRAALALEERPEIYAAISILQLEQGQTEEGLRNAEKATTFNLEFAARYEPSLRDELWARARERERLLKAERK
jgi:hypothetical protein